MTCEQTNFQVKPSYRVEGKDTLVPCYKELRRLRNIMRGCTLWMEEGRPLDVKEFYWLRWLYEKEVENGLTKNPLTPGTMRLSWQKN